VFGFGSQSWHEAVRRGDIISRPAHTPLDELFTKGIYRSRHNLKGRLLKAGLKQNVCELCGLSEWRGSALGLELHHVNGDRLDHRVENLQLLCPNCHSQTGNWGGRKRTAA